MRASLTTGRPGDERASAGHLADGADDDAAGVALVAEAARRVRAAGFEIGNVTVQIVCNRPRIGTRREEAEKVLSAACDAEVSVSAATTDGLGFPGRAEGIVALATALIY